MYPIREGAFENFGRIEIPVEFKAFPQPFRKAAADGIVTGDQNAFSRDGIAELIARVDQRIKNRFFCRTA